MKKCYKFDLLVHDMVVVEFGTNLLLVDSLP